MPLVPDIDICGGAVNGGINISYASPTGQSFIAEGPIDAIYWEVDSNGISTVETTLYEGSIAPENVVAVAEGYSTFVGRGWVEVDFGHLELVAGQTYIAIVTTPNDLSAVRAWSSIYPNGTAYFWGEPYPADHCAIIGARWDDDNDGFGIHDVCPDDAPDAPKQSTQVLSVSTADTVSAAEGLAGSGARTYAFWTQITGTGDFVLLSDGSFDWNNWIGEEFTLWSSYGTLAIGTAWGSAWWNNISIGDDHWHHIAVVVPDQGALGDVIIYLDGQALTPDYSEGGAINTVPGPLHLGTHPMWPEYGANASFDDLTLWDIALTREEVLNVIESELTGSEPGLVSAWNFEGNLVNGAVDLVGQNDLTLIGTEGAPAPEHPAHSDIDEDGIGVECDLCFGDNESGDFDEDGRCSDGDNDDDGDGILDLDDLCLGDDISGDFDADEICDDTDNDIDGDGVLNAADACPEFDDGFDFDRDNNPDLCDACPIDATDDADDDGLCASDDPCPADPANDADNDQICDSVDICLGYDDTHDFDADGLPNGCDACPADPSNACDDPEDTDVPEETDLPVETDLPEETDLPDTDDTASDDTGDDDGISCSHTSGPWSPLSLAPLILWLRRRGGRN